MFPETALRVCVFRARESRVFPAYGCVRVLKLTASSCAAVLLGSRARALCPGVQAGRQAALGCVFLCISVSVCVFRPLVSV